MQRVSQSQLGILSRNMLRSLQFIEAAQFGASLAVLIRLRRALDCPWDTLLAGIE